MQDPRAALRMGEEGTGEGTGGCLDLGVVGEDEFCGGKYREGVTWPLKKSNRGSILMHSLIS